MRGIIVTMIHKFRDMPPNQNTRKNIFVLIDEAHRTTGGDLGNFLMADLPNASFLGFTGTPVDKTAYGKGTIWPWPSVATADPASASLTPKTAEANKAIRKILLLFIGLLPHSSQATVNMNREAFAFNRNRHAHSRMHPHALVSPCRPA
jgi:hypothetical protein